MVYRKYLLTGPKVPRSTLCQRRRRLMAQSRSAVKKRFANSVQTPVLVNHDSLRNLPTSGDTSARNISSSSEQPQAKDAHLDVPERSDINLIPSTEKPNQEISYSKEQADEQMEILYIEGNTSAATLSPRGSFDSVRTSEDLNDNSFQDNVDSFDIENEMQDPDTDFVDNTTTNNNSNFSKKLCDCLDATVGDVVFMCLALGLRHNLTWEAQVDILRMVNSLYGEDKVPTSKRSYFNSIENESDSIDYHIYCPNCEVYLGKRDESKGFMVCEYCTNNISVSTPSNFFITLSLEAQFKKLLLDDNVASMIMTYRFQRTKLCADALEDIFDGEEYKKHFKEGEILWSPNNFSYSFFVDGVSTGRSTGKTMWPVYVTINELPPKERSKYILLAGLYIGPKDPNQVVFLQPFVDQANQLSKEGFVWQHEGLNITSKVIPLCAVVDSVARWQLLNMQSFNAFYGCTFCYQKQEKTAPKKRMYNILSQKADERTATSTFNDAVNAYEKRNEPKIENRHHKGVKGPSVLMSLAYFNLIWGFVVEYMHAILLGCIKTHMEYLFDSRRKEFWVGVDANDRIGVAHIFALIDARLLSISPPSCISRIPRSIVNYKIWKASEWRSWLLFYSVPCLHGILKDKHVDHLAMLSRATCLLLQRSVSIQNVQESHELYIQYCYLFQKYFKLDSTIYNLHLLTHIGKCVLNWGPLWAQNAFCYEGYNRNLLQFYKSPNNVLLQIARKFLIYSSIPSLCSNLVTSEKAVEFSENVLNRKLSRFVRYDSCILLGKATCKKLDESVEQIFGLKTSFQSKDCTFYSRILINGMKLTTSEYSEGKQHNDSYFLSTAGRFFVLRHIILLPSKGIVMLAQQVRVSNRFLASNEHVVLRDIHEVTGLSNNNCLKPSHVQNQCILMSICGVEYISPIPYGCRGD